MKRASKAQRTKKSAKVTRRDHPAGAVERTVDHVPIIGKDFFWLPAAGALDDGRFALNRQRNIHCRPPLTEHLQTIARLPRRSDAPHVQIIRAAVKYLKTRGQPSGSEDVIDLLRRDAINIPDEILDAVQPVTLWDGRSIWVDKENSKLVFAFQNHKPVAISMKRLQNIISEKAPKRRRSRLAR